jgi:DNA polymerase elongation subunit (family B)
MQMDLDYTVVNPDDYNLPKPIPQKKVAMVRMFGVTDEGQSVCANVFGVRPYMYAPVLRQFGNGEDYEKCKLLMNVLNVRGCFRRSFLFLHF